MSGQILNASISDESGTLLLSNKNWSEQDQKKKEDEAVIAARAVLKSSGGNKVAADNSLQEIGMQIALVRRFLKAVKS